MKIEITAEMIGEVMQRVVNGPLISDSGQVLVATMRAFADVINRDYEVEPKLCRAARPGNDPDFAYQECEGELGHSGRHYRYPATDGCEQW
jgi:hypothetical protein